MIKTQNQQMCQYIYTYVYVYIYTITKCGKYDNAKEQTEKNRMDNLLK